MSVAADILCVQSHETARIAMKKYTRKYYNGPLQGLWARAEPRQRHIIGFSIANTPRTDEPEEAHIHRGQTQRYIFETCRTIYASKRNDREGLI